MSASDVTGSISLRPLTDADVSLAWGAWLNDADTARLLNSPQRRLSNDELRAYLRRFDQSRNVLLGVFAEPSKMHIGLLTVHTSDNGEDALLNALVGAEHRAIGGLAAVRDLRIAVGAYLFNERKFKRAFASALSDNHRVIAYLKSAGWRAVSRKQLPDALGASRPPREVTVFQLTPDAWKRRNNIRD